ncbi:MAG: hypothetical protein ACK559_18905 [bacterium]
MDEVLTLQVQVVFFPPVAADSQYVIRPFDQGDHIRQGNVVLVPVEVQVRMCLVQRVPLIVDVAEPRLAVLRLLYITAGLVWVWEVNVPVEASLL